MSDADEPNILISDRAQHLIDTVIEIVSTGGFEALSVRTVANRAGVSVGAVQHHFPTKSQMLVSAMREISRREITRFEEATSGNRNRTRRQALLDLLLPTSHEDIAARVWLQLAARASVDPAVADIYSTMWSRMRTELAEVIGAQTAHPEKAMLRATELLALCDGLAVAILAEDGAVTHETARAIVDDHISGLRTQSS